MTTTIETLTDKQIRDLRTAAGQAGDLVQVAICYVALGEPDGYDPATIEGLSPRLMPTDPANMTQAEARAVCLDVILDDAKKIVKYTVNMNDSEEPYFWMGLSCVVSFQVGAQDSGRCRFTVETKDAAALELALDDDDDCIEYAEVAEEALDRLELPLRLHERLDR
jgi:hypothetical protein